MMTRTQLSFEQEMLHRARDRAGQLGISLAEYVRRLVAQDLGGPRHGASPSAIFDLGASHPGSNIAQRKEEMLGEAFSGLRP